MALAKKLIKCFKDEIPPFRAVSSFAFALQPERDSLLYLRRSNVLIFPKYADNACRRGGRTSDAHQQIMYHRTFRESASKAASPVTRTPATYSIKYQLITAKTIAAPC
jgi:hypothetical protein